MSALQTRTLGLLTDVITDERVLKSLQDNINEAVKPIEPGVFKFDAKAEAAMRSIAEILAQEFDSQIMRLPEYGGDSTLYSNKQIQTARASTTKIKT